MFTPRTVLDVPTPLRPPPAPAWPAVTVHYLFTPSSPLVLCSNQHHIRKQKRRAEQRKLPPVPLLTVIRSLTARTLGLQLSCLPPGVATETSPSLLTSAHDAPLLSPPRFLELPARPAPRSFPGAGVLSCCSAEPHRYLPVLPAQPNPRPSVSTRFNPSMILWSP